MSNSVFDGKINKNSVANIASLRSITFLWNKIKPFAILLGLWELIVQLSIVDPTTLPNTYVVGQTLVGLVASGAAFNPLITSLYRMGIAFVLAVAVGVPVGLLMGRFKPVRWFVDPIVSVAFPMPKIVILPMFLIWFGFGSVPIILLAAIGGVFPIIITTSQGARSTTKELVWTARSVNMNRGRILTNVVLPSSLPQIFNGLQIGLFLSIIVTSVSEMISSGSGLGQKIILAMDYYETSEALAYLIVIMIIGIVANALFKEVRAYVLNWTEDSNSI